MITQEYLQECFCYDENSGLLFWKERPSHHFKTQSAKNSFNAKMAMSPITCVDKNSGYVVLYLKGKRRYAHRLIYVLLHGIEPIKIDHIDGNRQNNRIENLRSVSSKENSKNARLRIKNNTGVPGVKRIRESYYVSIGNQGPVYLGAFNDFFEAVCARKSAEVVIGYHKNHGRV